MLYRLRISSSSSKSKYLKSNSSLVNFSLSLSLFSHLKVFWKRSHLAMLLRYNFTLVLKLMWHLNLLQSFSLLLWCFQNAEYNCRGWNRLSRTWWRVANVRHICKIMVISHIRHPPLLELTCMRGCGSDAAQTPTSWAGLSPAGSQSLAQEIQNYFWSKYLFYFMSTFFTSFLPCGEEIWTKSLLCTCPVFVDHVFSISLVEPNIEGY